MNLSDLLCQRREPILAAVDGLCCARLRSRASGATSYARSPASTS